MVDNSWATGIDRVEVVLGGEIAPERGSCIGGSCTGLPLSYAEKLAGIDCIGGSCGPGCRCSGRPVKPEAGKEGGRCVCTMLLLL